MSRPPFFPFMATPDSSETASAALSVENATVYLSGRPILHDIHWTVQRGERCFILGANGAGKTTLVRMLMGYAWPLFGAKVELLGRRFGSVNLQELRQRIAWVSPLMHQWISSERQWTGLEMVLSGPDATIGLHREPLPEEVTRAHELLESLRATKLAERPIHLMSSGEQVKVLIARALMCEPELMILDEPSVYLDIAGREFLLQTIEHLAATRPELTLVFITQRIEDILPTFSTGMILKEGRILGHGAREDILTEEQLGAAFDLPIRLLPGKQGRLWSMIFS